MTDANKALVRRYFDDILNGGNPQAAAELIDPHRFVVHHPLFTHGKGNVEDAQWLMEIFHKAFSGLTYTLEDIVAEHDKVTARWKATGTHSGSFAGEPPRGTTVTVTGTDIFAIADNRIVTTWVSSDLLGLMVQTGAVTIDLPRKK